MKKIILILFLVFFFYQMNKEEDFYIRILANSNNEHDLRIKKDVANTLSDVLDSYHLEGCNYDEIVDTLTDNLDDISYHLNKITEVKVEIKKHNMGDKTYNGKVIKGKVKMTLLVTIGEGKGDNWWGCLYPDFMSRGSDEKLTYKWWILGD